jgi:hypothetical protein
MTKTHEGWSNYATWAVNLWVSNDEGLYLEKGQRVDRALRYGARDFAEEIESWIEDMRPDLSTALAGGLYADLLSFALGEVNWRELATDWLDAAAQEASS